MGNDEFDLAGEVEQAWTGFRSRLADRIAELGEGDLLTIDPEIGADEHELDGSPPYLQFVGWGDATVRVVASSNALLDERCRLSAEDQQMMVTLGWSAPTTDAEGEGEPNFFADFERREADRLAVMAVWTLREVFACAHPVFLGAEGLEVDPDTVPAAPPEPEEADEPDLAFPGSQEELRELVDATLKVMLVDEPLMHDTDGDAMIPVGSSVLYVRVMPERPAIKLYAQVVVDVEDVERAEQEVAILNRSHPSAKFVVIGDLVLMAYLLYAWPFAPAQLRAAVAHLSDDLDDIARDLAARIGGHRFLEDAPDDFDDEDEDEVSPSLVGLLEMLYDGPVEPRLVAALFANDRHQIIEQLVRLRTDLDAPGEHDLELVLGQLRAALWFVAEMDALPARRAPLPPKPARSRQMSLLSDREDTLDTGSWSHDLEEST